MHAPAWSVVVPTYNRPAPLAACVAALAALHPPPGGYEIIVVNDGGVTPPDEVRAAAGSGNAVSAVFLTANHRGPASARNEGVARARGTWLAFTDDDCTPDHKWLVVLDLVLSRAPDALVGGVVRNALSANLFSEASQLLAEYTAGHFHGTRDRERFFTSNNIALSLNTFRAVGGFDTSFTTAEDREFCDRWHAQGRPSLFEPRAVVHHAHALTLASFLRQHRAYGRGARDFRAVRRDAGRPVRIDPWFYVGSLRHALRDRPLPQGASLAMLTAAALGAYLTGLAAPSSAARRTPPNAAHGRTSKPV